jgi:hypothetical protein
MLSAFVPAVLASVLVIRYADQERRKHPPFGRYDNPSHASLP